MDDAPIEISWTNRGEYVRLTVVDSGYGIAEEHIPRLTERFFRIDATRSRAKGGTGLGLAIVKHILVRHNSELRIKSKLNQGSTFFCDFVPAGPKHSATELNHEA
jgi:two-component system phosphate regulon sensor histidine kinase PhoR